MSAEPWTPDDDDFRLHQIFCGICENDGWPLGSAYRPHSLEDDCWCTRSPNGRRRGSCSLAVEFGLAPMTAKTSDKRLVQTALAMRITGLRITDDELRAEYESAIRELSR